MVILHAFLALAAGFAVTVLLAMGLEWGPACIFANLGSSFLAAAAGGYVTAWIAAANPLIHVLALGMVVLALAALSALQERGTRPVGYQLAQVAISPIGVLAGGLVRLRVLGIL